MGINIWHNWVKSSTANLNRYNHRFLLQHLSAAHAKRLENESMRTSNDTVVIFDRIHPNEYGIEIYPNAASNIQTRCWVMFSANTACFDISNCKCKKHVLFSINNVFPNSDYSNILHVLDCNSWMLLNLERTTVYTRMVKCSLVCSLGFVASIYMLLANGNYELADS